MMLRTFIVRFTFRFKASKQLCNQVSRQPQGDEDRNGDDDEVPPLEFDSHWFTSANNSLSQSTFGFPLCLSDLALGVRILYLLR